MELLSVGSVLLEERGTVVPSAMRTGPKRRPSAHCSQAIREHYSVTTDSPIHSSTTSWFHLALHSFDGDRPPSLLHAQPHPHRARPPWVRYVKRLTSTAATPQTTPTTQTHTQTHQAQPGQACPSSPPPNMVACQCPLARSIALPDSRPGQYYFHY